MLSTLNRTSEQHSFILFSPEYCTKLCQQMNSLDWSWHFFQSLWFLRVSRACSPLVLTSDSPSKGLRLPWGLPPETRSPLHLLQVLRQAFLLISVTTATAHFPLLREHLAIYLREDAQEFSIWSHLKSSFIWICKEGLHMGRVKRSWEWSSG